MYATFSRYCSYALLLGGVLAGMINQAHAASASVVAGQNVTLTVTASGTAPFTYQWYKNSTIVSGATSASYAITNFQSAKAGTYSAVVSNSLGSTTSDNAVLSLVAATAPAFTTQPATQSVSQGASVTFTVAASGTPAPTYQWRKNGTNISGATAATYTIASAASTDAATYSVVATNSAGSATSNNATLTVVTPVAPAITTQPLSRTVTSGTATSFSVVATGTPAPTYQWRRNGTNLSGATSSTYSITSTSASHAGTYTVVVTNSAGSVTSNSATLTVNSVPAITTQPASQSVLVGANVTFTVAASGNPTPTFQWRKNGTNISGATGSSYTITGVATSHAGTYTVVASNSVGSATSSNATLTVNSSNVAPSISQQPTDQTAYEGDPVVLSVVAAGYPSPTYQWRKNGVSISGATSASYTIPSVTDASMGAYTVVATNSQGSITSSAAQVYCIPDGFDVQGYFARNQDVAALYANNPYGAWLHFRDYGLQEGRTYDLYFRVLEYLELNDDIKRSYGSDLKGALMHWLDWGMPEGRMGRVPIGFNLDNYLSRYPDIAAAFSNLPEAQRNVAVWNHYLEWGVQEGRTDGDFDVRGYLAMYGDLSGIFGNDIEAAAFHWYLYGRKEGRRIPVGFDVEGYYLRNPDVEVVLGNDLYGAWQHYLYTGIYEGRVYDDTFRVLEYRARYSDVATMYGNNLTGVLLHWLYYGRAEGRLGRNP